MDRQIAGELEQIASSFREHLASAENAEDSSLTEENSDGVKLGRIHSYMKEVLAAIERGRNPQLLSVGNMTSIFEKVSSGASLEISDFIALRELLSAAEDAAERYDLGETCPLLSELARDIAPEVELTRSLDATFSPDGTILDTASPELASIRREISKVANLCNTAINRARDRYKSYLALPEPTIRNGRETLAVRSADKGDVPGIVIDRSKTGETLYVLTYELLELENRREKLRVEEMAEIDRILAELTRMVLRRLPYLQRSYWAYRELDSYTARVRFGETYRGSVAELSDDRLSLKNLIHPLIDPARAVPNTVELGGDRPRILIVSGPNAGGKSVLMKAVAIACCMNRMGLMVPAMEAALPVFDGVFALTGDSESLSGNLSSFSGHMKGLKEMYEGATSDSLVLVDEIGQGTSPEDGEALGYAFIDHISKLGCIAVFTTHYDGLKKLAAERDDILSGAMEFSRKDLRPTFRFLAGAVGNSYAFEVASQSGIPEEMIGVAEEYKRQIVGVDIESLERQLSDRIEETKEKERRLESKLAEANRLLAKRENAIKALDEQRENIKRKADAKVEQAAKRRIDQLDEIWNSSQRKDLPFNERARIKGEIRKIAGQTEASDEEERAPAQELKPGDLVVYRGSVGTLESISKRKGRFTSGGVSFTVDVTELRKYEASKLPVGKREGSRVDRALADRAANVSSRLNIIGMTVEEAIPVVDKFISDAVLAHLSQVTIVHGMGTFALRNGIREHLKRMSLVKSFHEAPEGQGAMGATVVVLR